MFLSQAQLDLDRAYYGGVPGVFVSGLVWLTAGTVAYLSEGYLHLLVFFFGGMLIHPLGLVIARTLGASGRTAPDNPLGGLALEVTVFLFAGLFVAWVVYHLRPDWFYPTMLVVIGARYVTFHTLYGNRAYWLLGGVLLALGGVALLTLQPIHLPALAGGGIELVFAIAMAFGRSRRR